MKNPLPEIRPTAAPDLPTLRRVLEETELFPPDMLEGMWRGSLQGDPPALWFTALADGEPIAFCYAQAEPLTDGSWNMLAIGVRRAVQGTGVGAALTRHLEGELKKAGARILIADTSGVPGFAATRKFYRKQGYAEEARIRDYWEAGDDKVTFRKAL